jgi:hypothetical protein
MDSKIRKYLDNLRSEERELQNQAFFYILKATEKPVDWAYEAWDELVEGLHHKDNHVRAISAQCLCNPFGRWAPRERKYKKRSWRLSRIGLGIAHLRRIAH